MANIVHHVLYHLNFKIFCWGLTNIYIPNISFMYCFRIIYCPECISWVVSITPWTQTICTLVASCLLCLGSNVTLYISLMVFEVLAFYLNWLCGLNHLTILCDLLLQTHSVVH